MTLARVCRMGWLELGSFPETVPTASQLLKGDYPQTPLNFFEELIAEIIEPLKQRPTQFSRKTAQNFREKALKEIFENCVGLLGLQLGENLCRVLRILSQCLTFDNLGIATDETSDDSLSLQIPSSWKPYFLDCGLIRQLESLVISNQGEPERLSIRVLNHLGAVRRSIFSGMLQEKQNYTSQFLQSSQNIMNSKTLESDSLFEFVHLCKRFLLNFGLRELSGNELFETWVENLFNFTNRLFCSPNAIVSEFENGFHIWSFLAYENYHQLNQKSNVIGQYVCPLFSAYVKTTLQNSACEVFCEENEQSLKDNLECIAHFSIYYYSELMRQLQGELVSFLNSSENWNQAKLAWLVYLASALVGLKEKNSKENEEHLDTTMTNFVLDLVEKFSGTECLEISFLFYFISLTKSYINCPLDFFSFYEEDPATKQTINEKTLKGIVSVIVQKLLQNFSSYTEGKVLSYSLEVFETLTKGIYSNRILLSIESVQNLIVQYKSYPIEMRVPKFRERLYFAIGSLWVNEEVFESLRALLEPMSQYLVNLSQNKTEQGIVLALHELKGLCSAMNSNRLYTEFFEWFYESHLGILYQALEEFTHSDLVMDSALRLMSELANSRNSRIKYDNSNVLGFIMFKNFCNFLLRYGQFLLERDFCQSPYFLYYKKLVKLVRIFVLMFSGGYVNFGVFEIFNDRCFVDLVSLVFSLLNRVSKPELQVIAI